MMDNKAIRTIEAIERTGVAHAFYTTLEAGRHFRINDPDSYDEYRRVAEAFGTSPERMVRVDQKHSTLVWNVREDRAGAGVISPAELGDGMITNIRGLMICTVEADCGPVYLLDPVKKVVGMVHSGWRGTADMISHGAIAFMKFNYKSEPSDIIAVLGPTICGDCYEVGDDLVAPFIRSFTPEQMSQMFRNMDKSHVPADTWKGDGAGGSNTESTDSDTSSCTGYVPTGRKFLLDIKTGIRITLEKYGVKPENIYDCGECTYENEKLASWRRDGIKDERMLTGIMLV